MKKFSKDVTGPSDSARRLKTQTLALRRLRQAFAEGRLTLYLGAGASQASQVPGWGQLVAELYINGIARRVPRFTSVPGLIPSVGDWVFKRQVIPLDVAARKLRAYYSGEDELMQVVKAMLYGRTGYEGRDRLPTAGIRQLLANNRTLRGVSRLCRRSIPGKRGVQSVITYNYDDFLEKSLGRFPYQSIWRFAKPNPRRLPIFHVHGFIPAGLKKGSAFHEIVLTEDQYNRAAQEPYSWQNLAQMRNLTSSIGLMIGLSISDRNLRGLLDALRNLPHTVETYALVPRPKASTVGDAELSGITNHMKERIRLGYEFGYDQTAIALIDAPKIRNRVLALVREVETQDFHQEETMLADLGVRAIWYEDHSEIEEFVSRMLSSKARAPDAIPKKKRLKSL